MFSMLPVPDASDNDTPLPLLVAKRWNFPLACIETEDGLVYAVQDWIRGITGKNLKQVKTIWSHMKNTNKLFKKLRISTLCRKFPYLASDGKIYQQEYLNADGLYQITQCLRTNTEIRDSVLDTIRKCKLSSLVEEKNDPIEGFIYILRCEWVGYTDIFKIGMSKYPGNRFSDLDRQYPFSFNVVVCIQVQDPYHLETYLHRRFSSQRVRKEWFRLSEDDIAFIREYVAQHTTAT